MKKLKKQTLVEPDKIEIKIDGIKEAKIDENVTFSVGIPLQMLFDEFTVMLRNVKKTLNSSKQPSRERKRTKRATKKEKKD